MNTPTTTGWYWLREWEHPERPEGRWKIIEIIAPKPNTAGFSCWSRPQLAVNSLNDPRFLEWRGPIHAPEEAEKPKDEVLEALKLAVEVVNDRRHMVGDWSFKEAIATRERELKERG